jgi:methyltransferase (TIGR00027 family)
MKWLWQALSALGIVVILVARAGHAVPPEGISWTARATCEFRALAAQHPDKKLKNRDSLATKLCGPVMLPREYEAARDVIDDNPEAYAGFFYVNARTRYIDHLLERAARQGASQIVVLGAGFDSRAYRFHRNYPKVAFFEVDLPATIRAKEDAVARALGAVPRYVHYASIDFDKQTLDSVLSNAGYDPGKRTFFILEGVTMYVSEAGIGTTLAFIGKHSPSGSTVVFDYILRRVADGDYADLYAASAEAKGVARIGEPFVTGWTSDEAAAFAAQYGLAVLEDLGAPELTRRYLTGSNGKPDGRIPEWYRIIDAKVR